MQRSLEESDKLMIKVNFEIYIDKRDTYIGLFRDDAPGKEADGYTKRRHCYLVLLPCIVIHWSRLHRYEEPDIGEKE